MRNIVNVMENNLFIKNNAERVIRGSYTDFLDPKQRRELISILKKANCSFEELTLFKGAEKTIIYSNVKPPVVVLQINSSSPLKHSDILGALFRHQINPSKYGDIIINDSAYLIVLASLKEYLNLYFKEIGRQKISLQEVPIETIKNYEISYEEIPLLVSSLRLDNFVSSITKTSRKETNTMFTNKYILVNYVPAIKKTYIIKEHDVISIRHYGKFYFQEVIKKTVKDKYLLNILKYK